MTLVQPSTEMSKMIRVELNENINTRDSDLEHIKNWLKMQPHLPNTWDDCRMMTFLRGCKFSLEKCKRKLDLYFTMRTAAPEIFSNRDMNDPKLQKSFSIIQMCPLPGLTSKGLRVGILRGVDRDGTYPDFTMALKTILMIGDVRLKEEVIGVAGDVFVMDAALLEPSLLTLVNPSLAKKFIICVQEAYPVKMKEIHVLNVSPLVDTIFTIAKPFLTEKIKNRVFFHNNLESLYKYVPKDLFPEEYGGNAGPLDDIQEAWKNKLISYTQWFKEQESIKSDESRRPGKPKNCSDLFGMEGSFRSLVID